MVEAVIAIALTAAAFYTFHRASCWLTRFEKQSWNARCRKVQERRLKEYAENERKYGTPYPPGGWVTKSKSKARL